MNYAQIRSMDISNGRGIGVSLYTSGCRFHCKNCFNYELWDLNYGKKFDDAAKELLFNSLEEPFVKRFTILGGEPMIEENRNKVYDLLKEIKQRFPDKIIWLYSGYKYEELLSIFPQIFEVIDILVDGQFIDALKDFKLHFRGSSNQRIIDIKKTREQNKIVLLEE